MPWHWLLAVIESVEPTAWPLLGIMAVSVAMYAVGILLPCGECCGCSLCTEGTLPETVTVTISGYVDGQVQGPWLAPLEFAADFGFGAAGRVSAPYGDKTTAPGPITAVTVTAPGEGYARIARVEPSVEATASGGSGATLDVTLNEIVHEGRPAWEVASVSVTAGGTGYPDEDAIDFSVDGTEAAVAAASFFSGRVAPTLSLSVSGSGSGATLTPNLSTGTYYGSGRSYWYISSVTIVAGGSGYADGDGVTATVTDGAASSTFYGTVTVDGSGAVLSVSVWGPGEYYKSTGVVDSAEVYVGGVYYLDDDSIPGETATVTVTVNQMGPTTLTAAGAVLEAVIDDDPSSGMFGQITGITITNGGDDYLAWTYRNEDCCEDYWNDMTVVCQRGAGDGNKCAFTHIMCGAHAYSDFGFAYVVVEYRGPTTPPRVILTGGMYSPCGTEIVAEDNIADCGEFSFTAENEGGVSVSVSAGGEYDPAYKANVGGAARCSPCCRGEADPPAEVEVLVEPGDEGQFSVVLHRSAYADHGWIGGIPGGPKVGVTISKCADPLAEDCDYCWKKCQTTAFVRYGTPFDAGCTLVFSSDTCIGCTDSTDGGICAPLAGTYVCDNIYNPSGYCSDGHSVWTVETT